MGDSMMEHLHWACSLALQDSASGTHKHEICHFAIWQGSHFFFSWSPTDCNISPSFRSNTWYMWYFKTWKAEITRSKFCLSLPVAVARNPSCHCRSSVWPLLVWKKGFNSFRAFWNDYCLESLRLPLPYPTIWTVSLKFNLQRVLNCLVRLEHCDW